MMYPMPGARCRTKADHGRHGFVRAILLPETTDHSVKVQARVEWVLPFAPGDESIVDADAIEPIDEPDPVWGPSPVANKRLKIELSHIDAMLMRPGD